MKGGKVKVSGVGCCLVDRIYNGIDFSSDTFARYLSKKTGDGGMEPGKLEFEDEFERFAGKPFHDVLREIVGDRKPDSVNIGGPCIVALINAAQLTEGMSDVGFCGVRSDDEVGGILSCLLAKVPVGLSGYKVISGLETASTTVFSDPSYDGGHGERIFLNTIGASWHYDASCIPESFYGSDIAVFGATAIVPGLHDSVGEALAKAKSKGCLTVVNTVFDSRNERRDGVGKWPMGRDSGCYCNVDVLVMDKVEALRLSGAQDVDKAMDFFRDAGVSAAVVTDGSRDVVLYAGGEKFSAAKSVQMPVSEAVGRKLRKGVCGDTTGCGDNFAGGIIASLVRQIHSGAEVLDFVEACRWGIISGGFACFYTGGTYYESRKGEKYEKLLPYYEDYCRQTGVN